ncbi:MAG: DMT family transporter [Limnothrix sp.]|uniref:DMT family transporter n=1 Tax=unclassified Limnothrix TaxID=2632864 RepID=UPI00081F0262|nr:MULTISPECIES: DMT family transporter [unclassified Limnothrix]MBD2634210.1 DMT family transporter [Limnothrix sp. FACHB-881]MEB3117090.1 DMT family transporter [Limnothrix sp.]OCQ91895.1 hypothetical protein BCR12_02050 [Limnothrix sp. P13C2]PIB15016.1 hypothetical protein AMR42_03105 [Limnothrix sp. PR1529]
MIHGVERADREQWLNPIALLVAGVLWGSTYVVVKSSLEAVSPSVLMLVRFGIATIALLPITLWSGLPKNSAAWAVTGRGGLELGFWMALGYVAHTIALQYTTAGRSAFITALYVVLVPLLTGVAGQRLFPKVWWAAAIAALGVALLSYDGAPPNIGDLWSVGTAITWSFYIWRMEAYAARAQVLWLSLIQLGITTLAAALWVWGSSWAISSAIWNPQTIPWLDLVYLGTFATAGTAWLQAIGQRSVAAPVAAILYTLEPVWAALMAAAWLGEQLGDRGRVGAALVLGACLLCQLPVRSLGRQLGRAIASVWHRP